MNCTGKDLLTSGQLRDLWIGFSAEIKEVGLDQFLSSRRRPRSPPGTINVSRETETSGQIYEKAIWTDVIYHWQRLVRTITRRP